MTGFDYNDNLDLSKYLIELDCDVISNIFKKIKYKGILSEPIRYSTDETISTINILSKSEDFRDQIKMYRMQKGVSMRSVASYIGKNLETYRMYETKYNDIQDYKVAEKIIQFLNLENILELPDYLKIMKKYTKDEIIKIANKYGKKQFSIETNIPTSTINFWNKNNNIKSLSTNTYKKIVPFFNNHNIEY